MRYYDPQLGAFISPDPALSGINHYVYASGDPINRIDLTGLEDWFDGGGGYWDPVCTDAECSGAGGTAGGGGGGSADDTTTGNENPDACVYGKSCRPERSPSKPSPPNPWKTGHASPGVSYSDVMGSTNDIAFNTDTFFDFFTAGDQYIEDEVTSAIRDAMVLLGNGKTHYGKGYSITFDKGHVPGEEDHYHWDKGRNPRVPKGTKQKIFPNGSFDGKEPKSKVFDLIRKHSKNFFLKNLKSVFIMVSPDLYINYKENKKQNDYFLGPECY